LEKIKCKGRVSENKEMTVPMMLFCSITKSEQRDSIFIMVLEERELPRIISHKIKNKNIS
jgi:hypothetical protein